MVLRLRAAAHGGSHSPSRVGCELDKAVARRALAQDTVMSVQF